MLVFILLTLLRSSICTEWEDAYCELDNCGLALKLIQDSRELFNKTLTTDIKIALVNCVLLADGKGQILKTCAISSEGACTGSENAINLFYALGYVLPKLKPAIIQTATECNKKFPNNPSDCTPLIIDVIRHHLYKEGWFRPGQWIANADFFIGPIYISSLVLVALLFLLVRLTTSYCFAQAKGLLYKLVSLWASFGLIGSRILELFHPGIQKNAIVCSNIIAPIAGILVLLFKRRTEDGYNPVLVEQNIADMLRFIAEKKK